MRIVCYIFMESEGRTGEVGPPSVRLLHVLPIRERAYSPIGSTQETGTAMPSKKSAIKTYVAEDEHREIIDKADQCGLSVSNFTKRVCLGYPIKSLVDQQAVREVIRINGDLGRLGGLLKMWLTNDDEHGLDVKRLIGQLEKCQAELKDALKRL